MLNEIDNIRREINLYFDPNNRFNEVEQYGLSESGLYYFTSERYKQTDPKCNWVVCKIEIWDTEKAEKIYEYITDADDTDYCAKWLSKNNKEYLILPEAFQGQSIFDVNARQLHSFYSSSDPFIWTGIYPSPDGNKIAVDGCYWACPNELRIYNTENITALPYPLIYQESGFTNKNGCAFEYWADNNTVVVCRNKQDIIKLKI